jgi:GGDEF domain-containing protein
VGACAMQSPVVPSPTLARLAWVATLVALIVSVALLVTLEDHTYAGIGLILALCLAGMFVILELRLAWALGRSQTPAAAVEHGGPAEGFLESLLDPETALPRFWLFSARLTEEIRRAERHGRALALCALEPDDLTVYLDETFRRKAGRAVRGHLRTSDSATVGRSGRLLVLFAETAAPEAEAAARRLVKTLNSLLFEEKPRRWRAAMVFYPQDGMNTDDLLQRVDGLLANRTAA